MSKCIICKKTNATYNFKGLKRTHCAEHKLPNMVDVKNKTCEKCDKQPVYNFKGLKTARFCTEHKEKDMVNVVSKTCENSTCDKRATYNFKGLKTARFCILELIDQIPYLLIFTF